MLSSLFSFLFPSGYLLLSFPVSFCLTASPLVTFSFKLLSSLLHVFLILVLQVMPPIFLSIYGPFSILLSIVHPVQNSSRSGCKHCTARIVIADSPLTSLFFLFLQVYLAQVPQLTSPGPVSSRTAQVVSSATHLPLQHPPQPFHTPSCSRHCIGRTHLIT